MSGRTLHETRPLDATWTRGRATQMSFGFVKGIDRYEGERVVAMLWHDDRELELRHIRGAFADVETLHTLVIPTPELGDEDWATVARTYAHLRLSGAE